MGLVLNDLAKETTTTVGTGTLSLAGAASNHQSIVDAIGDGNTGYFVERGQGDFEVFIGTVTAGTPDTLTRDTVLQSSNADALVGFAAGSKDVYLVIPASKSVYLNAAGEAILGDTGPLIKSQKLQSFIFRLRNDGGTIKHRFGGDTAGNSFTFGDKISGAVTAETATPTGADGSTAMAAGCKIGSASTHVVHFDTAAMTAADFIAAASLQLNQSGTALSVGLLTSNIDINGTTLRRLSLQFTDASSGAAYDIAGTLPSAKVIDVRFEVFVP